MPAKQQPFNNKAYKATNAAIMPHQLFHGTTWHSRLLPSVHKFAYPYRYWGVNISALAAGQALPEVHVDSDNRFLKRLPFKKMLVKNLPLFSAQHKALQQFYPEDYLQQPKTADSVKDTTNKVKVNKTDSDIHAVQAFEQRLRDKFIEQTGSAPIGDMIGMLVCRNVGIYFSPVNFYLGFDKSQTPTHLLAEVSNTPWNKRHYYGFLLDGAETQFCHHKDFHVSPFNPIDQLYRWQVSVKQQQQTRKEPQREDNTLQVRIAIDISDVRGEVLKTGIKMTGITLSADSVQQSLRQNPLMNMTSLSRIYWHAFKLYAIKKVPYINYDEKLADSEQQENK